MFGTVYKMQLPEDDITTLKQWDEQKKAAAFESFLSFLVDNMKFKVSELHVKLERSEDPSQIRLIEPLNSTRNNLSTSSSTQDIHTNDGSEQEARTSDFWQQCTDQTPTNAMKIGPSGEKLHRVSMVFG